MEKLVTANYILLKLKSNDEFETYKLFEREMKQTEKNHNRHLRCEETGIKQSILQSEVRWCTIDGFLHPRLILEDM